MKKIITLNKFQFSQTCFDLLEKINNLEELDLIILIPRAGNYIEKEIEKHNIASKINRLKITKQRKTTKYKEKMQLKKLIKHLPRFINDLLRSLECAAHEIKSNHNKKNGSKLSISEKDVVAIIKSKNILIIDDAIDSGETILSIKEKIFKINEKCNIKTAAITTTFKKRLVDPDFYIYNNTIVRFHWSEDFI